jgi:hypothetical protein
MEWLIIRSFAVSELCFDCAVVYYRVVYIYIYIYKRISSVFSMPCILHMTQQTYKYLFHSKYITSDNLVESYI